MCRKQSFFAKYKAWFATAACLALVLVGTLTIPRILNNPTVIDDPIETIEDVQGWYDVKEYASAGELSEAIGFTVKIPTDVPFEHDNVSYAFNWGSTAEINWYSGEASVASLRAANTTDDVSGDYNEYATVDEIIVNEVTVTARGNNGGYCSIIWSFDNISYALFTEKELTVEQLKALISSML